MADATSFNAQTDGDGGGEPPEPPIDEELQALALRTGVLIGASAVGGFIRDEIIL